MTFTEIVFEVADDRYPLCKLTAPPSEATAVLRVLDTGRTSGRFRTLITFYGSEVEAASVARELRAFRQGGEIEVLALANGAVTIRTDAPSSDAGAPGVRMMAVLRLIENFGPDTMLEPFVVRRGRVRARVLVPKRVDTQRALVSLQEIQRSSGFSDFRIVRVATMEAPRYLDHLRRVLTPDQEELLRLATQMGYYNTPKGATLEDIAGKVGLSVSPVHKRLKTIEETLVSSHVEPARAAIVSRRRRRRADVQLPASWPAEIALRVRLSASRIAQFTAAHPGARALLQVLSLDAAQNQTTFLLVVLAGEAEYQRLIEDFERRPDVVSVETVDRDRNHISAKVTMKLATQAGATFPWWTEAWGNDAIVRPFVFEEGEMTLRFLVARPMPEQEVQARLEKCAKLAGWDEFEIVSARATDDVRVPVAPPEPPTARQEEVLKIAHALGYYRTPRACTLEQVAATLGVSANAIHKNLSSAESKVIAGYLSAGL